MTTYGILKVGILISDPKRRIRRVTLFKEPCEHAECVDLYTQFLEHNPHLDKNDLEAIFAPEPAIICI